MPQRSRVVAVGVPHHITQRGNARQDIFVSDKLRRVYLAILKENSRKYDLRILAYCLMTNHVHLVVVPERETSMASTFRRAHARFGHYWNAEFARSGHLWQNRYYSCPVGPDAVGRVIAYVENNPVRASMVDRADSYRWSSCIPHLGGDDPIGLLDWQWWRNRWDAETWRAALEADRPTAEQLAALRQSTGTGRPYGSRAFVEALEVRLNRTLAPRPGGRLRNTTPVKKADENPATSTPYPDSLWFPAEDGFAGGSNLIHPCRASGVGCL